MQLGFRRVGVAYPLDALGDLEQRIAAHMAQLGLLFTLKTVRGGVLRGEQGGGRERGACRRQQPPLTQRQP